MSGPDGAWGSAQDTGRAPGLLAASGARAQALHCLRPCPSGLPKSSLVQHTAWSLMGRGQGGQGKQRLPTSRARAREGIRESPGTLHSGSGTAATKMPWPSCCSLQGQDFVLLCPPLHPTSGRRPTGAALGEVEEQTQKMRTCPHKDLNPRVHSSCILCGPKLKQPRHPWTGKDKQTVVCPYSRTAAPPPTSNKNQCIHLCNRMHDAENPGAEEEIRTKKEPILSDSSSVKFQKRQNKSSNRATEPGWEPERRLTAKGQEEGS